MNVENNCIGKTLNEVRPALYEETVQELLYGGVSPTGAYLDKDEALRVAEKLAKAVIRAKCGCGQEDCNSYHFQVALKPEGSVRYLSVRLYSRGEHLLHIDSDGDVYEVERLHDLDTGPLTKYVRQPDASWKSIAFPARGDETP